MTVCVTQDIVNNMNSRNYVAGLLPGETIRCPVKGECVFLGTTKTGRVRYRRPDGTVVSGHGWWFFSP